MQISRKKVLTVFSLLMISFTGLFAQQRPVAPTNVTASLNGGTYIYVNAETSSGFDSVHVVLVTSLANSFQDAFKTGNVNGVGNVIAWSSTKFPVSVNVSDNLKERFFVATAVSNDIDGKRIFSGWKVWCDTSGIPLTVSTACDSLQEEFYYRARRISDNESEVVFDFSFSVPSTGTHKFELRSGSSKLLSLTNLSTVTSYSNVKEVLDNVNTTNPADSSWFLLKQSVSNGTAYTIYYIKTDYASSEEITALLVSSDGNVIDTTATDIPVIDDEVTVDINKTIFTLASEPKGTVDPINPGIFTPSFSKGEKLQRSRLGAIHFVANL